MQCGMVQAGRRHLVIAAAVLGYVANKNDNNNSSSVTFNVCSNNLFY